MRKIIACLFIFVMLANLYGCGGAEKERRPAPTFRVPVATATAAPALAPVLTPAHTPAAANEDAPLSELVISCRPPRTLNPLLNADFTVDRVLRLLFEPMVVVDAGGFPAVNGRIIEGIVFARDGLSADVTVADGARWEDGEAVTGADLAFSIETLMGAADDVVYKGCVKFVEGCAVSSPDTVTVRFTEADVFNLFAFAFPVVSRDYYGREVDADSPRNMRPLGNGAFSFAGYEPAKRLSLAARGADSGIETVTALFASDGKVDAAMFETGATNALFAEGAAGAAGVKRKDVKRLEIGGGVLELLAFNAEATGLGAEGRALRQAVLALNAGVADDAAVVKPVEALAGRRISLPVARENAERVKAAYALGERLTKAGAVVTLEELPFDEFAARLENGDFTVAFCGVELADKPHEAAAFLAGLTRFDTRETGLAWGKIEAATGFDEYREALGELEGIFEFNAAFARLGVMADLAIYDKGFAEEDIQFVVGEVLK